MNDPRLKPFFHGRDSTAATNTSVPSCAIDVDLVGPR